MGFLKTKRNGTKGQAATELAVFGAILIFLIGSIIRSSVQASYQQNQQLKAMRLALLKSWESAQKGVTQRNSASVLFIEDRLTPDLTKYGPMERVPYILSGSGTFTNQLMQPTTWNEHPNLPLMDVFINGQHFTFRMGGFVIYAYRKQVNGVPPKGISNCKSLEDYHAEQSTKKLVINVEEASISATDKKLIMHCDLVLPEGEYVEDKKTIDGKEIVSVIPIFYSIVANKTKDWSVTRPCGDINSFGGSTVEKCFDLNRNGNYSDDPTEKQRKDMAWQWMTTPGQCDKIKIDHKNEQYPQFDVDGDHKEEVVYRVNTCACNGESTVWVLDGQMGDLDTSHDEQSPTRKPGLQPEMSIYTQANDGTYLEILEGNEVDPVSKTKVKSISRKDQVELVSRMFQLSTNSGRFCSAKGIRQEEVDGLEVDGKKHNPVEICGKKKTITDPKTKITFDTSTCLDQEFGQIKKTCFDVDSKMLYIRSRILDRKAHVWKTDIDGQEKGKYGEFKLK